MQIIRQDGNENDCGVCCVAMLADVSFEDALRAFGNRNRDGSTKPSHIHDAFNRLGFSMSGKCGRGITLDRSYFAGINENVLLRVERSGRNWHWAVWNGEEKCVHDPLYGVRRNFPAHVSGYYRVRQV